MASSLNASTSGGGGVITTADSSGNLNIQSGGSTVVAVTSTGATVTGTLAATGAVTLTGSLNTPNTFGFKNRIINGGMVIDQRNAGASVTPANNQFLVDRFFYGATQTAKFTAQQNAAAVTPPTGYISYLGLTSSSAYSIAAGDVFFTAQPVEGLNVSDFGWGTANAQSVTLSFWVRSSLTGTFGGALRNSAATRAYPFSYSVSVANTWEQKTITVAGDTTGTWLTTNGIGVTLAFSLGAGATYSTTAGAWAAGNYYSATGATSVVGTNGATFYITGVQLEKGSTATSFDFRDYGRELAMCQRYYTASSAIPGLLNGSGLVAVYGFYMPSAFRATPSISYTGTANFTYPGFATYTTTTQPSSISSTNVQNNQIVFSVAGFGATAVSGAGSLGQAVFLFSAEL